MLGTPSPFTAGLGLKGCPQRGFPFESLISVFTEVIPISPLNRGTSVTWKRTWVLKWVLVRTWSLVVLVKMFKAFFIVWGDLSELSSEVGWLLCHFSCPMTSVAHWHWRDSVPSVRQSHFLTLNPVTLTHTILGTSCRTLQVIWFLNPVCPAYAGSFLFWLSFSPTGLSSSFLFLLFNQMLPLSLSFYFPTSVPTL